MQHANLTSERLRRHRWLSTVATAALIANAAMPITHASADDSATASPIKHVIIIIGENRSFDHVFATYKPVSGDKVLNLLSEGIVKSDGSPGPNYGAALQYRAEDFNKYRLNPPKDALCRAATRTGRRSFGSLRLRGLGLCRRDLMRE